MMKLFYIMMGIIVVPAVVTSCADLKSRDSLSTVPSVDLGRYAGTWYEIARLPMWFQRHCVDSTATYTPRSDGTLGITMNVQLRKEASTKPTAWRPSSTQKRMRDWL